MKSFLLIILLVLTFLTYKLNQEVSFFRKENEVMRIKYDSLKNENFINLTNSERYQIANDRLLEESKRCGEMYDKILSHIE